MYIRNALIERKLKNTFKVTIDIVHSKGKKSKMTIKIKPQKNNMVTTNITVPSFPIYLLDAFAYCCDDGMCLMSLCRIHTFFSHPLSRICFYKKIVDVRLEGM